MNNIDCELNSNSCQAATGRSNSVLFFSFLCSILINLSDEYEIHSSETELSLSLSVLLVHFFLNTFQSNTLYNLHTNILYLYLRGEMKVEK